MIPSALIGGGLAWFASKRGRHHNIGSLWEQSMLCNSAGKPGPEAITAREFLIPFGGPKGIRETV